MKTTAAYMIDENIILQAMSLTDSGLWIAHGDVLSIRSDDRSGLVSGIKKSLAQSTVDIAHPPPSEWKHLQRPLLQAAGVRTWTALGKQAKAVSIEYADGKVAFIPAINFREHGGHASDEQTIHCRLDDDDLSARLIEAFQYAS